MTYAIQKHQKKIGINLKKKLSNTHTCVRVRVKQFHWTGDRAREKEVRERERERNFKRKRMWVRMKNKIHKEKHRWAFSVRDNVWWSTYRLCYAVCVLGSRFVLFTKTEWTRTTIIDEKKIVQWTRAFARKYQMYNSSTITTFSRLLSSRFLHISIYVSIYCTSLYMYCLLPVFSGSFSQSLYDLHFLDLLFVLLFIFFSLFFNSIFVCSPL